MNSNLVARLREACAEIVECDEGAESGQCALMREAADEIERLRNVLTRLSVYYGKHGGLSASANAHEMRQIALEALNGTVESETP